MPSLPLEPSSDGLLVCEGISFPSKPPLNRKDPIEAALALDGMLAL